MNVLKEIVKELAERIEGKAAHVLSGNCKNLEEYRGMTGEIQGLSVAHNLLTDLVRKIESGQDVE